MNNFELRRLAGLETTEWDVRPEKPVQDDMSMARFRQIAGLPVEGEEVKETVYHVPHFSLENEESVKAVVTKIAKAGYAVDMEYFMGAFFFNFKDEKACRIAKELVRQNVDVSNEKDFQ